MMASVVVFVFVEGELDEWFELLELLERPELLGRLELLFLLFLDEEEVVGTFLK